MTTIIIIIVVLFNVIMMIIAIEMGRGGVPMIEKIVIS